MGQPGPMTGAGGYGPRDGNWGNRGSVDGTRRIDGPIPAEVQRGIEGAYRDSMRELQQLRQSGEAGQDTTRDIQELMRQMARMDPSRFQGNPALIDQIVRQLLPSLQQLEIQLRRQIEEKQGGQARTAPSDSIPAGYAESVAEYFRKLSKGTQK